MEATINTKTLQDALNIASMAAPKATIIPALTCVRIASIDNNDNEIELCCSSMDQRIAVRAEAKVLARDEFPEMLFQLVTFAPLVRLLKTEHVVVKRKDEAHSVLLSGVGRYELAPNAHCADFPQDIAAVDSDLNLCRRALEGGQSAESADATKLAFQPRELMMALRTTCYAVAGTRDSRYVLQSVLFEVGPDKKVTCIAADGRRAAISTACPLEISGVWGGAPKEYVVPDAATEMMKHILAVAKAGEPATLEFTRDHVRMTCTGTRGIGLITLKSKLIDFKYPSVRNHLMNIAFKCKAKMNRNEIMDAIRRASLLARDPFSYGVNIEINQALLIKAADECGGNGEEQIAALEFSGQPVALRIDPKYVLDYLNNMDGDTVIICAEGPCSPVLFSDGQGHDCYIMPLRPLNSDASP